MLTKKQLIKELYKLQLTDTIYLRIQYHTDLDVELTLNVFEALKLITILPNKPNKYNYEKVS